MNCLIITLGIIVALLLISLVYSIGQINKDYCDKIFTLATSVAILEYRVVKLEQGIELDTTENETQTD